ncbi:alpha-xylosidase [Nakamurella sp. GG22]
MKFSDGYWHVREGFDVQHPAHVTEVSADERSLTVLAPTKVITSRGDTLNRPTATITLSSPAADVIKVRVEHHAGGREPSPQFALPGADDPHVRIEITEDEARLTSGHLSARVRRGPGWQLDFLDGGGLGQERVLTSSGPKTIGLATGPNGSPYVFQQLALDVGEKVYGLGERFGPVAKNGQPVDIWNADGGTSSDQAYKNVPFFWTTRGYGVFVNHPEEVSFEIGSEAVSRNQFSVHGQFLEYFVVHGPTPKQILERYTALTGRPPRVPDWSFGLWLSTSFTTDYDEKTVSSFIDGMAERDIPLSVFHFDCFWMREFRWCDFEWDPETFPEPEAMLARLKDKGLRICVWINPYIAQRSALFDEGKAKGYLVTRPDGSVWQWDRWQAGMALVDFTNPAAAQWYSSHLERLIDQGVDAFKTDFGERIPTDVVWSDGSDPQRMHNYYTQLYNRTVFDLLERRRGTGEAVLFARSATAGGQQYPVHWGGDCDSTYASMAETLRGGLSLAASGFGYWSHDIGGFEGTPDAGVFKRWLAFGLLSSHSRLHGSGSYRVPWAFDDEAVEIARRFTRLKMSLMPYLAGAARQVEQSGTPILRPMVVEFPYDPATEHLDTQYMLGDSLLVAPVFTADGMVRFYVPDGTWTHLLDGHTVSGPRWVTEQYGFDSVPVFVRPGAVMPVGRRDDRPDVDHSDGVALQVFDTGSLTAATVDVPGASGGPGSNFDVTREGDTVTVTRIAGTQPWSVVLPEGTAVLSVTGGEAAGDDLSTTVELGRTGFRVRAVSDTVAITMTPGSTAASVPEEESPR